MNKFLWAWMARMEIDYNLEMFIEKLIMVCTPSENPLDISVLVFQGHFVCKQRHKLKILAKL